MIDSQAICNYYILEHVICYAACGVICHAVTLFYTHAQWNKTVSYSGYEGSE